MGSRSFAWAGGLRARTLAMVALVPLVVLAGQMFSKGEARLTGATGVRPSIFIAQVPARGGKICQSQAALPGRTGSVDVLIGTFGAPGPALDLTVRTPNQRIVARGRLAEGWSEGPVTIPIAGAARDMSDLTICIRSQMGARLAFAGELDPTNPARVGGQASSGRLSVVARSQAKRSVAQLLPTFARGLRYGGANWLGEWTAFAMGALLCASVGLGGWAIVVTGEPRSVDAASLRRPKRCITCIPRAAWALAAAAMATGTVWAFLTPPFQVPDETAHFAYVQYVSESGHLPTQLAGIQPFSPEERATLDAVGFGRIVGRPLERVATTAVAADPIRRVERNPPAPRGGGNAETAGANPPLYYLIEAPVYLATSGATLLTRLLAMRLVSVVLISLSVLCAFLFVRELLPNSPWTWTAGGLACAFQPVLGFIGSGVNPDSLVFLSGTALLLVIARTLRSGLTSPRAIWLGVTLATGMLTKPLFLAFVPVAAIALLLSVVRQGRSAVQLGLLALTVAAAPVVIFAVVGGVVFDHPYFAVASDVANGAGGAASTSFSREGSYVMQLFLPRLPFLTDQLPGFPLQQIWIAGIVGVFGWVDYGFGPDAVIWGTRVFIGLLTLLAVAVLRNARSARHDWRLALCCLIALGSIAGAVGVVDYQAHLTQGASFEQARYLLPLLALYAGMFGLATKALGRSLGYVALVAIWVVVSLHTVAAMILTLNRYYL